MLLSWLQSPAPERKLHEGRSFCIFCFLLYLQHLEWHRGRFKIAVNPLTSVLRSHGSLNPGQIRRAWESWKKTQEPQGLQTCLFSPGGSSQESSKTTNTLRQDKGGLWPSGHAGAVRQGQRYHCLQSTRGRERGGRGRWLTLGCQFISPHRPPKGAESVASY